MKFLFWQFALYAIGAFALGFVAAWSWFREQLREVGTALERTRARVVDAQDARRQLQEARAAAATAKEGLELLRERFADSETVRTSLEVEVHSLRNGRMKLLTELSELRSSLDSAAVSRTHLTSAQHEAGRLRALLDDASEQLRTERVAREQTLTMLKTRLADVELELATYRHAAMPGSANASSANAGSANTRGNLADHAGNSETNPSTTDDRPNNLIPFVGSPQASGGVAAASSYDDAGSRRFSADAVADRMLAGEEQVAGAAELLSGPRVEWSTLETPGTRKTPRTSDTPSTRDTPNTRETPGTSIVGEGGARILDLRGDSAVVDSGH